MGRGGGTSISPPFSYGGRAIEPRNRLANRIVISCSLQCLCTLLFVNWGLCCRGVRSTYNIRIGRSPLITGPYLDKEGKDLLKGGGTLLLDSHGPFMGPGHAGIFSDGTDEWFSCHFYDGTRFGAPRLALLPLRWSKDKWPEVMPR